MRVGFPWISLESLAEFRVINGLRGIIRPKVFLSLLSAASAPLEREPAIEAMLKSWIVHKASLSEFLIFCNRLSAAPFPFGNAQRLGRDVCDHGVEQRR